MVEIERGSKELDSFAAFFYCFKFLLKIIRMGEVKVNKENTPNQENVAEGFTVEQEKKKDRRKIKVIGFLSLVLSVIFFLAWGLGLFENTDRMVVGSAVEGALNLNNEELMEALQREANETRVTVQLNGNPVFENGESEGTLLLGNPEVNMFDMYVKIYLDETDQLLYDSGLIKPNHVIETDNLLVNLDKGDHNASAQVTYFDENENVVSNTSFGITITVLN